MYRLWEQWMLHQQPQEFCATISVLYQWVKKMLPVRCNKKSSIKHFLVYQEKKYKVVIVFGCYFMGIWQQLRLDVQISLNFGS